MTEPSDSRLGRKGHSKARSAASPSRPEESFAREIGPHGALHVGSAGTVARKIARTLTSLGANRFVLKYGMGGLSQEALIRNIELYGTQVVPRVRELLGEPASEAAIEAPPALVAR